MKKRWIAVLEFRKMSDVQIIEKALEIKLAMTGNAYFPAPDPTLAELEAQAIKTNNSYLASRDAGKAKTDDFHHDLDDLERLMLREATYVQIVANKNPDIGDTIIDSAKMKAKNVGARNVPNFSVSNTLVKGEISGRMKSQGADTIYLWDYREKGSSLWIRASETSQTKYIYGGLTSVTAYEFRGGYKRRNNQVIYFSMIELTVI